MDDGAAALEPAAPDHVTHVHRIGCLLHVLHISVNAEMANVFFHGPAWEIHLQFHRDDVVQFFLHPSLNQRQTTHLLLQTRHSCLLRRPPLRLDIQRCLDCTRFRFRVNPTLVLLRQLRCCIAPQPSSFSCDSLCSSPIFSLTDDLQCPHCIEYWQRRVPELRLCGPAPTFGSYHARHLPQRA